MFERIRWLLPAIFICSSCIPLTVNVGILFPDEEMKGALFEMEKEMRDKALKEAPAAGNEESRLDTTIDTLMIIPRDDFNINVKTPQIKAINERRMKRLSRLKSHFVAGRIGEGIDASLKVRNEEGLDSAETKERFRALVNEENNDRTDLLKEILKENKMGEDMMARLRRLYAKEALQQLAEKGWWIEVNDGEWKKKE